MGEPQDREWLLARERGEDVSHIPATTRVTYAQVEWLLAALCDPAPPAGWKRRVLDALAPEDCNAQPARTERSPRGEGRAATPLRTPRS